METKGGEGVRFEYAQKPSAASFGLYVEVEMYGS